MVPFALLSVYSTLVIIIIAVIFSDQVSVQLTPPSRPPADVKLPDIVNFLRGNGTLTSWVDPGVANELGVASVIGDVWKTGQSNLTDFVIRRLV